MQLYPRGPCKILQAVELLVASHYTHDSIAHISHKVHKARVWLLVLNFSQGTPGHGAMFWGPFVALRIPASEGSDRKIPTNNFCTESHKKHDLWDTWALEHLNWDGWGPHKLFLHWDLQSLQPTQTTIFSMDGRGRGWYDLLKWNLITQMTVKHFIAQDCWMLISCNWRSRAA